jgi:hypothetical protein
MGLELGAELVLFEAEGIKIAPWSRFWDQIRSLAAVLGSILLPEAACFDGDCPPCRLREIS